MMVPPIGTEVASEKLRTGLMDAPATPPDVIEKKAIEVPIKKLRKDNILPSLLNDQNPS